MGTGPEPERGTDDVGVVDCVATVVLECWTSPEPDCCFVSEVLGAVAVAWPVEPNDVPAPEEGNELEGTEVATTVDVVEDAARFAALAK